MKPSIGRIVIVNGLHSNGTGEQPAIITRVWSDGDTKDGPVTIGMTIFQDKGDVIIGGAADLYESKADAEAAKQAHLEQHGLDATPLVVAYWPERV